MTILGIDLGKRKIGIAISDELRLMAHPLGVLKSEPRDSLLGNLKQIIQEKNVKEIIIGLPVNMNATLGPKAQETFEFVEWLRGHFDLVIHTWDERLTTLQGTKLLVDADLSRKQRRRVIDSLAAQILLQAYLDRSRAKPM